MRPLLPRSPVAQLAEHPAVNRRVVGSSPTRGVRLIWLCANRIVGGGVSPEISTCQAFASSTFPVA